MTEKKEITEQILSILEYLREQGELLKGKGITNNVTLYYGNEDNQRGVHINLKKIPVDIIKGDKNYYLIIQIGRYTILVMNTESGLRYNVDVKHIQMLVGKEIVRKKNKKNLTSLFNRLIDIGLPCTVQLFSLYDTSKKVKSCSETDIYNIPMNRIESDKDYFIRISVSIPGGGNHLINTLSNEYDHDLNNFYNLIIKDIQSYITEEYIVNQQRWRKLDDILNDNQPITLEEKIN